MLRRYRAAGRALADLGPECVGEVPHATHTANLLTGSIAIRMAVAGGVEEPHPRLVAVLRHRSMSLKEADFSTAIGSVLSAAAGAMEE